MRLRRTRLLISAALVIGAATGCGSGHVRGSATAPETGTRSPSPGGSTSMSAPPVRVEATKAAKPTHTAIGVQAVPPRERSFSAPVRSTFFGMHVLTPGSHGWPQVPIGSVRIWDMGTRWMDLQPISSGSWSYAALAALDTAVATARAHGADPLIVLGQTPRWAARNPSDTHSLYGPGAGSPPRDFARWSAYVAFLAKRYAGRVGGHEIWNEPDYPSFFSGSPGDLARLALSARAAIKSVDPHALVVSPSYAARDSHSEQWISGFLSAGGGRAVDVWNLHMYPPRGHSPEALVALAGSLLDLLHRSGQGGKPVWDTERAYGLASAGEVLSGAPAIGYVARGALVDAGLGISRSYWYAWEDHSWSGLFISRSRHSSVPTAAGTALSQVQVWLLGARVAPCKRAAHGVWWCALRLADGTPAVAEWAMAGAPTVRLQPGSTAIRRLGGPATRATPNAPLTLGPVPILVLGTQTGPTA